MIAYICAGDPHLEATESIALALERAGVDLLELGVPFSDPLADGVVNQLAAARALEAGTTLPKVLDCVQRIRAQSEIPIILYTYMNPVYRYGFQTFLLDAEKAGVDGVLLLDLPPDEAESNPDFADPSHLRRIRLIAPTTPPSRLPLLTRDATGFLYYVSREGVTGERSEVAESLPEQVAAIRKHTSLPIAVGFGISTPEHVRTVAAVADGVVVGSAIVKKIAEWSREPDLAQRIENLVRPLAQASKGA
jgi:tryptophan synthase alpha chain